MHDFFQRFGIPQGGMIRCDEGGELSRSTEFRKVIGTYNYAAEPTGAETPVQNAGVERYNDTLSVLTRSLLYGPSLCAQYWSAAVVYAAYIMNQRYHHVTQRRPYEHWYGVPDLKLLKLFGS